MPFTLNSVGTATEYFIIPAYDSLLYKCPNIFPATIAITTTMAIIGENLINIFFIFRLFILPTIKTTYFKFLILKSLSASLL